MKQESGDPMTPKKPVNPFAAITDAPLSSPPPDRAEERHGETVKWFNGIFRTADSTAGDVNTIKWLLVAILLVNLTTCASTCSVAHSVNQMRVY